MCQIQKRLLFSSFFAGRNGNMIYFIHTQGDRAKESRENMRAKKEDVLKRLNYIEGHLKGIRKMVDEDQYCVDILRQTYAVRKSLEKLEAIILDNHLRACVAEGITSGKEDETIEELIQLFNLAGNR
jgi:CsoR family transcriptional regulator, copper-sensing transcriptional repressor